jgi:predicted ester cyclase
MTQTLARAELQAVSDRLQDAFTRRDPVALAACYTPDGVAESPMFATLRGRKAIEEAQRAFFTSFPDATMTIDATVIDPPYVAVFSTVHGTHGNEFFGLPGTGRHVDARFSRLLKIEGDLIAHETRIYDFTGLLVQVGVLRAKPAKPLKLRRRGNLGTGDCRS